MKLSSQIEICGRVDRKYSLERPPRTTELLIAVWYTTVHVSRYILMLRNKVMSCISPYKAINRSCQESKRIPYPK